MDCESFCALAKISILSKIRHRHTYNVTVPVPAQSKSLQSRTHTYTHTHTRTSPHPHTHNTKILAVGTCSKFSTATMSDHSRATFHCRDTFPRSAPLMIRLRVSNRLSLEVLQRARSEGKKFNKANSQDLDKS